jgi:tetratricopeptide (TPR) repeat protein
MPTPPAAARARTAAERAAQLQPDSPDALVALGAAKAIFDWDWQGSERDMQHALDIHPGSAQAHYLYAVVTLQPHGRWTEALREMEIALRLDPVSPVLLRDYGMLHFMRRDWKSAEEIYRRLGEVAPGFRGALYWKSRLAIEQGRLEEALALLQSRIDAGRANTRVSATAAWVWARLGHTDKARAMFAQMAEAAPGGSIPPLDAAIICLGLEEWDDALAWLTKACEQRAAPLYQFAVDPFYDPVRRHPPAQSVRRVIGVPNLLTP